MNKNTDIAIVGMSGVFPGAGDVKTFWKNIEHKIDAIRAVPENRLDPVFFDPSNQSVDRFYCRRGGFIDEFAEFDPVKFGILPLAVEGTEPEHLLTLHLAYQALEDAAVFEKNMALDKAGIIIGKGNYAGPGAIRAIEIVRTGEQIVQLLKNLLPQLKEEDINQVKKEFQSKKGRFNADTAMGLIPNLVASLVANRLNLVGPAYTVDAACASSLLAIDHAVQELRTKRCELVIAGGVHICHSAPFWSIFSMLGALSKNEQIRPFDRKADGLLIGEGCGFVVLKRLEDAIRDDHKIYAVIKGVGVSSDGSGNSLMSPSVKGQSEAILQAWQNAGLDPAEVGYIEAHGTGTPLGDKTELETLARIFGHKKSQPKAGIGTVKSMIGHAMPAAGIAGLIKTALALYHSKLPPTLHCEEPLSIMSQTRFEPVQETIDWNLLDLPKRAGVNAFGFGGINAHVVLEGFSEEVIPAKKQFNGLSVAKKDEVRLLARTSKEELLEALRKDEKNIGDGIYRIAVFDPTPERLQKAINIVGRNISWRNKQDIWYSHDALLSQGGKVAFLFPGLDALSGGEVESVANYFHLPTFDYQKAEQTGLFTDGFNLVERSRILDSALKKLGVSPDLNAGHSLGEWLAGRSSEMVNEESVFNLLTHLDPTSFASVNARFLMVGCSYSKLLPVLEEIEGIYLSNDNCPQQVILCGTYEALEKLIPVLKQQKIFHQILPFQSGFHSPFIKDNLDRLISLMEMMKFRKASIPLWSATTLEAYPEEYEQIRQLSIEHLIKPVRFRELTEKLYKEGVRMFIQVGSGSLIGFIDDTLKNKIYSSISSNVPIRPGLCQLQRVLAALFVEGRAVNLPFLGIDPKKISKTTAVPLKLQLNSPLVTDFTSLKGILASKEPEPKVKELALHEMASPVMKAFQENCTEITEIQAHIIDLFNKKSSIHQLAVADKAMPGKTTAKRKPFSIQLDISLSNSPYLLDHSLIRQRSDWPCVEDMEPVIPMTMMLEIFGEITRENAQGGVLQKLQNIKVLQWMKVATPFKEIVKGDWMDTHRLFLNIEKYASAEVYLSNQYNQPVADSFDIGAPMGIPVSAEEVYEKNMFHGPAYQGIKHIKSFAEKGISGIIEGNVGKGSLLDNAGQLFGLWLQLILQKDRIAFPVKIQEVEFYGNMQDQQGRFECTCQLTELTDEFATANILLKRNNQVWAMIKGWQNRRLEIDERLWNVVASPLYTLLSDEIAPGVFMFYNAYFRMVSWDFILKRYFNQTEKKYHESMLLNKRRQWLISRVAVKDAIRALLLRSGNEPCYPIEFEIQSNQVGKPFPVGNIPEGIHISLAHKANYAVAIARFNQPVGIDIEEIQERSTGFIDLVVCPDELVLLEGKDMVEWMTRCWVAKEAYGKYLGKGFQGNPKAYVIQEICGEEVRIKDSWIKTIKHHNYIIGWTR